MENREILKLFGLDKNESTVYLTLVEKGPSLISEIERYTGIHRPIIYKTISRLEVKSLITVSLRQKRRLFVAESPEKLNELFNDVRIEIEELIPKLQSSYEKHQRKPIIKVLQGKEGLKSIFEDLVRTMKRNEIYYRYSSRKISFLGYLPKDYVKIRDAKNLQRFVITSEELGKEKIKEPKLDRAFKVVPSKYGLFDYNIIQIMYRDRVAIIDFNTETGVVIQNEVVAEFQKKIFKVLYDLL